jgi:tetratricopeptide (TPR) repeat protein
MKIILSLVLAVTVVFLLNNLGSNVYAQEIHCPLIHPFLPLVDEQWLTNELYCSYEFEKDIDGDGDLEQIGDVSISASLQFESADYTVDPHYTCWESNTNIASIFENTYPGLVALKSNSHYIVITYQNYNTPFSDAIRDTAIRFLSEVEGSGLALPCESSDFEFDIDVPVFETVKQGDPVRIPVEVTLVKGEPKQVSLSTTTWQESLGIYGWFETSTITPTQRTYLIVQTSCSTPRDNYQFYANGVATSGDVPASSTDMVTVTVESASDCPQNNQPIRQQPIISGSVSESLDSAYQLTTQGKYQEALPYLDSVLQQAPDNIVALYSKAYALRQLEEYEDALSAINQVLVLDQNYEGAYFEKGYTLGELGRYEESIKAYQNELQIDPNDKDALLNIGWALNELGRYEEAIIYFDKALTIDPNYDLAQENKEYSLAKINEQESPTGGGCLIATATFGSELAPQVQFLREIRDNTVLSTASGTSFMTAFNSFYYLFSPTIADLERQNPVFKEMVKATITPLLSSLVLLQYVDIDTEQEILGYGIGIILLNIGMYFVVPALLVIKLQTLFKK